MGKKMGKKKRDKTKVCGMTYPELRRFFIKFLLTHLD